MADATEQRRQLAKQLNAMAYGLSDLAEGKRRRLASDVSAPMGMLGALQLARQTAAAANLAEDEVAPVMRLLDQWDKQICYLLDRDRPEQWARAYEHLYEATTIVATDLRVFDPVQSQPEKTHKANSLVALAMAGDPGRKWTSADLAKKTGLHEVTVRNTLAWKRRRHLSGNPRHGKVTKDGNLEVED
jgi:hypothetical protein